MVPLFPTLFLVVAHMEHLYRRITSNHQRQVSVFMKVIELID
jgi:hypothetical protein